MPGVMIFGEFLMRVHRNRRWMLLIPGPAQQAHAMPCRVSQVAVSTSSRARFEVAQARKLEA